MKKISITLTIIVVLLFSLNALTPPYVFQALTYFVLNSEELEQEDLKFANSEQEKWQSQNLRLLPIFKTQDGARLYYIGVKSLYGKRYDIAFLKGAKRNSFCAPSMLFSDVTHFKCDIPLASDWVLNYESLNENEI